MAKIFLQYPLKGNVSNFFLLTYINNYVAFATVLGGRPISRREFLKFMGCLGIVSLGGLGGFMELYKKRGSFTSLVSSSGSSSVYPLQNASAQTGGAGSWSLGPNTPFVAIHAAITYTGKIFYFAGSGYNINNEHGPYNAAIRDPSTGSDTAVSISEDLFCAHSVQLPSGKILTCGGTLLYDTDVNNCSGNWNGLNAAYNFDSSSNSLVKLTSMSHGRWYPTLVSLPNGTVVCVSGFDEYGANNTLVEVYDPSSNTWSIKYDPSTSSTYCVGSGMTSCPGAGSPCYGGPNQGVSPWLNIYPRMNLMPSGLVYQSGMGQTTRLWDPAIGKWTTVNLASQARSYGTSILLPLQNTSSERGKVMLVGGSSSSSTAATSVVEIEDFNAGTSTNPVKRTTASINHARKWLLPIILPTGKIAIFGGTSGGSTNTTIYIPELFDPENESQGWADLPSATVPRKYHGVALLLPDGSVWTAGSAPTQTSVHELRTEIFKPSYFSSTRPTISGTPTVGGYGQSITIPTPDAANITRVSLVRLGATTHHYDTDARLVWLQITSTTSNSITVSAPLNASLAPPGYYMIHVLNSSGTPSVAKIIQIPGSASSDTTPPSQVTGLTVTTPSGTSTQLSLAWNANTETDLNHYNIYRGTTTGFPVNTSTDTPIAQPTTNSFTDSGLTASTTYYYKVAAVDNTGNIGALSAEASGTTGAAAGPYHYAPYLTLTGTNRYDVPSTSSLQLTQFSVASWFQTSKVYSTIACIANKGGFGSETAGLNMNYGIWVNANNKLQAGFETSAGTDNVITTPNAYSDGQWHYAVVTYDGSVLNLYVDNIKVATKSTSGAVPDNTGTQPFRVGANSLSLNYFFTGNVDEVRVWSRALTASEVASQYNSGTFDTTGQLLYLPFS